ncbi:MAG: glycyl-radical enzyme activating protein [Clostridia bacterium]|nr:glycyl-radical enzyme activating protein [Clostridia bacterium]
MTALAQTNGKLEGIPLLTNIQRYSLQDGPGIRTTVFLKGCPLRCPWCHNPETQLTRLEINYEIDKCTGCARCAEVCPSNSISIEKNGEEAFLRFNRSKCIGCGKCADVCITHAREIVGKEWSMESIIKEATADRLFYTNSGGGVTISGGDPMYFQAFTTELARRLQNEDVHVAIETSAFGQWHYFEKLMKYVNLFMIDIKTMDANKYKNVIKGDLRIILNNLEKLVQSGAIVRVRLPIIPGFNNQKTDYEAYAEYLGKLSGKIEAVDILPFHSYGEKKYKLLGIIDDYKYRNVNSMESKEVKTLIEMLTEVGFVLGHSINVGGLIGVKK